MIVMDLNSYTQLINIFSFPLKQPIRPDFFFFGFVRKRLQIRGGVVSVVTFQWDAMETAPQLSILQSHHSL